MTDTTIPAELSELNRDQLRDLARDLGVEGYSTLTKADLLTAVAQAQGSAAGAQSVDATAVQITPAAELQARARALDVTGRSNMDREELTEAIAATEAALPPRTPGQASAAGVGANAALGTSDDPNDIPPGTPEQVGRPDLLDVAQRRGDRTPYRELGA